MELQHFIQKDIRNFLDNMRTKEVASTKETPRRTGVLSPEELAIYSPGRDFTRELHAALQQGEFPKAKRILNELKESYAGYPEDAPERIEGNRLLESLYNAFQKKLADEHADEPDLDAPTAAPPPEPAPEQHITEEEENALISQIAHVETLVKEHEYISAISLYQDLKQRLAHDSLSDDQKKRIVPRLSEMYKMLHDMIGTGVSKIDVPKSPVLEKEEQRLVGAP